MKTLKSRVIISILGIVVLTTTVLAFMVRQRAVEELESTLEENALNLLDTTRNNVESQYNSIHYHKNAILTRRKSELKSAIDMAYSIATTNYDRFLKGELDEETAKHITLEHLKNLRYDNGVGYFWVNNTDKSYPTLIMHPTMPELVGKKLDAEKYNCVIGTRQNLFHAFIDTCLNNTEGYVDYRWPKPTQKGLTEQQPKTSYVKLFKPWNFIIGTGVYVDDIEKEATKRLNAVIDELSVAMGKQRIGEAGYFYIFNENGLMLVHPHLANQDFGKLKNIETGNFLCDEIKHAANTSKSLEYLWDKPGNQGEYIFRKKIYVTHFAPLGWYIAVSVYKEDFEKRVKTLTDTIMVLSGLFILASLILALWLSSSISKPLQKLTDAVKNTGFDGLPSEKIPTEGTAETQTLGATINKMVNSIKASKENLLESEMRFRSIFEAAGEAIWLIGTNSGAISEFNNAAHQSLGYPRNEFSTLTIDDIEESTDPAVLRQYTEELSQNTARHFESKHRTKDNELRNVLVTCKNIHVGEHSYNLIIARDVTDKTRMEELMVQSEKMLSVGGLAAGLAHEINNPLAGIIQNVELLGNRLLLETPANTKHAKEANIDFETIKWYVKKRKIDKMVRAISDAGMRAAEIVRSMLSFARKESGNEQPIQIHSLLDKTIELAANDFDIKQNFDFKKIKINRDYKEYPIIQGQPGKIQQVILNILKNGADAMRQKDYCQNSGPQFTFKIYSDDKWAVMEITDNGPGIKDSLKKRVFEPFYTTKPIGEGTGLGMSVSFFIIHEDHDGQMEINSSLGEWTRFTIKLPLIANEMKKASSFSV